MTDLKQYLEDLFATPANTTGMGNVSIPTEPNVMGGSGDIPQQQTCFKIKKRKKKFKRYKIV